MFEEKLVKTFDGTYDGTCARMVTWEKTVSMDTKVRLEMGRRFNYESGDLRKKKILVVGAGTLSQEMIKDLILAGASNITVVDMDTTEYWNLPRCALLRSSDVGKSKALETARRAAEVSPFGATVTGIHADITTLGFGFFEQFDEIVSPVDRWSIRAYVSAGASLYGKTHISCGTALIGDMMFSTITVEPAGCRPCYSCMIPGTLKEEEKKLSCLDYKPQTQPQVMPFSSAAAGLAVQMVIGDMLGTLDIPTAKDGSPVACKYIFREFGKTDDRRCPVVSSVIMSRPDEKACIHHGSMTSIDDGKIHDLRIRRDCTNDEMISSLRGVFGYGDEFMFDLRRSMLFYMAFPPKDEDSKTTPVSSISFFEGSDIDTETIGRLPREHIYYVSETGSIDPETKLVRMILE